MGKKRDIDVSKEAGLIWKVANDVLRDVFQRTEYPDIIYPMVLIRRLECVLKATKEEIKTKEAGRIAKLTETAAEKHILKQLYRKIGYSNNSGLSLETIKGEGDGASKIKTNFKNYLNGFHNKKDNTNTNLTTVSGEDEQPKVAPLDKISKVIKNSGIRKHIDKLSSNNILYSLVEEFTNIDLTPSAVSNIKMGYIFEELIRRFSEQNNAEAGEHYTPREVIDLMIAMLGIDERKLKSGELITIYDPACGTGGMLTTCKEYIEEKVNPDANVRLFGQEVNDKTWAICEADLMIKGEKKAKVVHGDTLFQDGFPTQKFDYMISNPPYGKSWSKIKGKVMKVSNGRFEVGQPRSSDGQLLFTLHMISKMKKPENGGSAIAIVHNGSPLFSGDAGSGESNIRGYLIANDLLETIVAMPTELFYNTGIATYIWVIRNNKPKERQGKVQLINAIDFWDPMKRSLGNKRRFISGKKVEKIVELHKDFQESEYSKIYDLEDFAYRKVYLDLWETDENGNPAYEEKLVTIPSSKLKQIVRISAAEILQLKDKSQDEPSSFTFDLLPNSEFVQKYQTPDSQITIEKIIVGKKLSLKANIRIPKIVKDTEIIPWKADWEAWLQKEVEKQWTVTNEKKGYEIPFTREFYVYEPLPEKSKVLKHFKCLEQQNQDLLTALGIKL